MVGTRTLRDPPNPAARVSRRQLAEFCDYVATMLEAGLTLLESLDECALNRDRSGVGRLSGRLALEVRGGSSFASAVQTCGGRIPVPFGLLAATGERSGSLGRSLHEAAELLREDDRARSILLGAAAYPLVVTVALLAFLLVLQLFVIPGGGLSPGVPSSPVAGRFEAIRHTAQGELVVAASLILLGPLLTGLLVRVRARGGALAATADRIVLGTPLFGKLLAAREMRILAVVLHNFALHWVSIENALWEASSLLPSIRLRASLKRAADRIEQGTPAGRAMAEDPLIPRRLRRALSLAERTGDLSDALRPLVEHYRWECLRRLRRLEQLAEPLLIAVCGTVVVAAVVTVVLPLLSLFGEAL